MLKLLFFKSCPNYPKSVELLKKAGLKFELIDQDDLLSNDPLKDYASPTLLDGEKIIFGSRANGGGCSVHLPSVDELAELCKK